MRFTLPSRILTVKTLRGVVAFIAIGAGLPGERGSANDWPEFGGSPCKNMVSDEKNLPAWFEPGKKSTARGEIIMTTASNVVWGVRTSANTYSTPTVAGGKIFIGGGEPARGFLKCLDARNGRVLWQYVAPFRQFPDELEKSKKFMLGRITPFLGVCATATVDGDRLYFVNHRCEVMCLDANGSNRPFYITVEKKDTSPDEPPVASGVRSERVLWTFDLWGLGVRPSDACDGQPLVDGDLLYVCTSNGVDRDARVYYADDRKVPAPNAPNMVVLDKQTGRLVATDDAQHIGPNLLHGQWSSPSLGTVNGRKLVFFGGGDGCCYAFEALAAVPENPVKLKTVWFCDCNPPEYKQFGGLSRVVHYCLGDKRLRQSLNKKDESSFTGMSEIIACPVFYNNRVYVAIGRDPAHGRGRGALWCLDATKTGDITRTGKIWCYQGLDRTLSTVSISDGLLYIADVGGRLHCLDAETGACQWIHDTNAPIWSSTLVADGKVYLPTTKHFWVLAAGRQKKVLSEISLGAPGYASPVAADGTLYISSRNYLWAVRKQANP
jgi:outer membrane protein assembly factor BamB